MQLFISYSRKDFPIVDRLRNDLRDAGIDVWIDKVGLTPGTLSWEQALRDAIQQADAVLLCASTDSRKSEYVRDEVALAKQAQKVIYPAWVAGENWLDCIPLGLGGTQNADLRGDHYPTGLMQLIAAMRGEATSVAPLVDEMPPPTPPTPDFEPRNPYKGLRAFRPEDQRDFFGRDALIANLLAQVEDKRRAARLLAVLGASGSGKSSVMMAGLLPRLREKHPDWVYLDPMVPGAQPLEKLTIALARRFASKSQAAVREDLTDPSTRGLHRLACELSDKPVILYIDQFEEVFTLANDEGTRRQFIDLLSTAVTEPDGVLYVLLSMRADFYDRPLQFTPFGKLLETHHVAITPMTLADLYDVVQKPARLPDVRLTFDEGLVNELVFAVREETAALPLLQFTLDQLFERRAGQTLTLTAYRDLGGIQGALAKHADATYSDLPSDEHRRLARALFLRLIEPGQTEQDTTRRRATYDELTLPHAEQTRMLQQTADAFVDARLLVSDQSGAARTLEVSHEALIREWDRLRDWLHEAREDVTLMKRIAADAAEWAAKGQPEEAVYRGRRLREAQDWAANNTANATETAFIDASAEAEQAQIAAEEQRKAELRLAAERAEQAAKDAQQSAERAEYQRRRALLAVGFAGLIIAVALIVGVLATQQVNEANVQVANANATLMPIPGTLVAANAQVAAAGTAQDAAEARAAAANAQVANANATLTPIPGTLAAAAAQLNHATATLGFVQGQGTQVAAQATYFGIEQARIGTLAAGAVVIPPGTLTPELLLPTLTGVAQLRRWEPRIIVDKITGVQIEMVEVPPGCFIMGSIASGDEGPVNEQCFTGPFYIDRYEVTQAQFTALNGIMEKNFVYPGYQRPVDNITWFEARDFCEDRRKARLPTEREWEYAARGPDSLTYPWGNIFVPENVIYSRTESQGTANVVNVDGSPARPDGASWVGALDMSGNVFEWTSTRFGELNYSRKTLDFKRSFSYPYRPDDGREADETRADYNRRATEQGIYTLRVIRGGSANDYAFNLRSAARTMGVADNWSGYLGFRCARSS